MSKIDLERLDKPFPEEDIEWRIQSSGMSKRNSPWAKVLAYVTNRAIMDRLDDVCGKERWQNDYKDWPDECIEVTHNKGGYRTSILLPSDIDLSVFKDCIFSVKRVKGQLCGISIKIDDEWVTKWDGAENTDFESIKGGFSASMKRAAVQWGIGRYLYKLEMNWASFGDGPGKYKAKINNEWYEWNPPQLPAWALPEKDDMFTESNKKPNEIEKIMTQEEKEKALEGELF